MPYLASTNFDAFLERLTVSGDQRATAKSRRDSIAGMLSEKFTILEMFATGSLVRGTGLKNVADVDVMVVLHYSKHLKDKTPVQALEMVREALSDYQARIVKKNGQAVTLYFKTWPNVDIVPAMRVGPDSNYVLHIPDANTGAWIPTDPAKHDRLIGGMAERGRQLIRMMKCWNGAHSSLLQSFHIEQIALETQTAHHSWAWGEDDWPWAIKGFFEKALALTGPSDPISNSYSAETWQQLRDRLRRGQELATQAWLAAREEDVETMVERCRILFGDKFPAYG